MRSDISFVVCELAALGRMNAQVLRATYRQVFGEETTSRNATCLRQRLASWIQSQAEDGFSERTVARIAELLSRPTATPPGTRRIPRGCAAVNQRVERKADEF